MQSAGCKVCNLSRLKHSALITEGMALPKRRMTGTIFPWWQTDPSSTAAIDDAEEKTLT